ncbi:MAG: hypothetical protein HOM58_21265, partial [Rhodospirillaceae bacterium]|nr:hypothetical protein [Rhodospirillaceae bacterium]
PLDETVRAFQRDHGLKEDGLITPAGPTERNIQRERGAFPAEPSFDLAELDITAPIGNGLTNQPQDIIGVSKALGRLGLFNFDKTRDPLPIITRRLVAGMEKFQQDNGLPVTGELKQGDKAHEALLTAVAEKTAPAKTSRGRFKPDAVTRSVAEREDAMKRRNDLDADTNPRPRGFIPADERLSEAEIRKLDKLTWKPTAVPFGSGKREVNVKGPIRVDASTATLGNDSVGYRVDWHPLDENGRVLPVFRDDKKTMERRAMAANNVKKVIGSQQYAEPPFDWPHGFRATVFIPPQADTSDMSLGVLLQIMAPEGGAFKSKKTTLNNSHD